MAEAKFQLSRIFKKNDNGHPKSGQKTIKYLLKLIEPSKAYNRRNPVPERWLQF